MINVIVADTSLAARADIRLVLCSTDSIGVTGETTDCMAALALASAATARILLVGPGIGVASFDQIAQIKDAAPHLRVLVVVRDADDDVIRSAFRAGASGCVATDALTQVAVQAVRTVARGGVFVAPASVDAHAALHVDGQSVYP